MKRVVAIVVIAAAFLVVQAQPAAAVDEGAEREFVSLTNSTRSSRGVGTMRVDSELTGIARRWSAKMASENRLSHNPNLGAEVRQDWEKLGENVGTGDNPSQIHDAFMNSPAHRANILDGEFTHVGIGVERGADGRVWVTEVFMRLRGGGGGGGGNPPPTTAAPPPPPPPTTARVPVATTARSPRPTVTTLPPPPTTTPVPVETTTTLPPTTTTTALQAAPLGPEPTRRLVLVLDGLAALDRGR